MRGSGEQGVFAEEGEAGEFGQDELNASHVLLEFEAACGVEEDPAGTEQRDRAFQDGVLENGELAEAFFRETPGDVGATADDAGVGARDVREDEVEGLRRERKFARVGGKGLRLDSRAAEIEIQRGASPRTSRTGRCFRP